MIHLETEKDRAIYEQISHVTDPDIGLAITELGLIYEIQSVGSHANVKMTFTSMACPSGAQLKAGVEEAALRVEGIESVEVEIVWSPKWNLHEMASELAKEHLGVF